MSNLFNAQKLKEQIALKKITMYKIGKDLNIDRGRISELCSGIEHKEILIKICSKYNLNIDDFYEGFIEPNYMKNLRKNIKLNIENGIPLKEIASISNVCKQTLYYIMGCNTYICHINTANKINNAITNNIFNLKKCLNTNMYNKLLEDANNNFNGNINEILKFIIYQYFYK